MFARLIVRLPNWLGDTVMAVPALASLRAAFPDARVLAAGPWSAILAGQGLADVLLEYPRAWSGRLGAADVARDFRASAAIVLPNSFESALAARYWRAARRVGFATGGRSWLLTDTLPLPAPRRHQVDEYLLLAEALGAAPITREPRLEPPVAEGDERREVRRWLSDAGVGDGAMVIGVHLGAAYGDAKIWPTERVVDLVRSLRALEFSMVLLGPADTRAAADTIVAATGVPSLVGRDRPGTLRALLSEIDVLVVGDTGVAHLAAALGTRAVTLFGPTDPALTAPRGPGVVVRRAVPCAPCFYRRCPIEHPCMRGITGAEVADQIVALARAPVAG